MFLRFLRVQAIPRALLCFSLLVISFSTCVRAQNGAAALSNPATEKRVELLLQQMTLEEKVGQLVLFSAGQPTGPGTGRSDYREMIRKGEVGSLLNLTGAKQTADLQRIAVEKSRLHIPLLFGLDVIHGFKTTFPVPIALASSWDARLVEQTARIAARESSASGIRWIYSPMVDVARDARWGRMTEGSGEDTFLGEVLARAYVRGYQGERLSDPGSIAACPKHFVGYGAAEGGRDYNSVDLSDRALKETYLPPFREAIDAGAASIMSSFNTINGVPATANRFTLTDILRREWGFRGLVVSDWSSVSELIPHGVANDGATAARRAIQAGLDVDMASSLYHENLLKLVHERRVSESEIDEAVRRVLRVKIALGLFERPYANETDEMAAMLQPESIALARAAAEKSFVLLKNDPFAGKPILPLARTTGKIALIGPLADSAADMLGSWAGMGDAKNAVTLRAALAQELGADRLLFATGGGIINASDTDVAEAVAAAKQADVVILALGEEAATMTGEATSRAHLRLPGRQEELLESVVAAGKPTTLILFTGRPLTLPWAFEHVPAVIEAWFPGLQAGPALVRTLFGEANPSGKLTVTWPRSVGQEPLHYDSLSTGRPVGKTDLSHPPASGEEKYVSRYIDEQNSPQFPFGYGLSYSSFHYGAVKMENPGLSAKLLSESLHPPGAAPPTGASVSAEVTNSSERGGEEIVQLYVGLSGTSVARPVRLLKGFQKIRLAPGERRKVSFDLPATHFAFWNERNEYIVEPARVNIWISSDSASGSAASFEINP